MILRNIEIISNAGLDTGTSGPELRFGLGTELDLRDRVPLLQ